MRRLVCARLQFRARLGYKASLAAQRMEDVVIGDTMAEYDVAHRADTLLDMVSAGLPIADPRRPPVPDGARSVLCDLCSSCPTQHS